MSTPLELSKKERELEGWKREFRILKAHYVYTSKRSNERKQELEAITKNNTSLKEKLFHAENKAQKLSQNNQALLEQTKNLFQELKTTQENFEVAKCEWKVLCDTAAKVIQDKDNTISTLSAEVLKLKTDAEVKCSALQKTTNDFLAKIEDTEANFLEVIEQKDIVIKTLRNREKELVTALAKETEEKEILIETFIDQLNFMKSETNDLKNVVKQVEMVSEWQLGKDCMPQDSVKGLLKHLQIQSVQSKHWVKLQTMVLETVVMKPAETVSVSKNYNKPKLMEQPDSFKNTQINYIQSRKRTHGKYKCPACSSKFADANQRYLHLVKSHGAPASKDMEPDETKPFLVEDFSKSRENKRQKLESTVGFGDEPVGEDEFVDVDAISPVEQRPPPTLRLVEYSDTSDQD